MKKDSEILIVYQEIIDGYSQLELSGFPVYLKHLDSRMSAHLESIFLSNYYRLKKKNVQTEEEKLSEIIRDGYWTDQNEESIKNGRFLIDGLRKAKAKQRLLSQRKIIEDKIKSEETKIEIILNRKSDLIGTTVEGLCNKKKNLHMLGVSFYRDPDLKEKLFETDDLDYENSGCIEALSLFAKNSDRINDLTLKKIALSNFFVNSFVLSDEDIPGFFGRPIVHLTYNQSSLIHHGKKYLNIFREMGYDKIPFDIREDADKLVDWFEVNKNAKDVREKGMVGGTKEDKRALGIQDKNTQLIKAVKEKGGSMGMYDFNDSLNS